MNSKLINIDKNALRVSLPFSCDVDGDSAVLLKKGQISANDGDPAILPEKG
jgi:hypothetical protein